jgi:hypothetical protein
LVVPAAVVVLRTHWYVLAGRALLAKATTVAVAHQPQHPLIAQVVAVAVQMLLARMPASVLLGTVERALRLTVLSELVAEAVPA